MYLDALICTVMRFRQQARRKVCTIIPRLSAAVLSPTRYQVKSSVAEDTHHWIVGVVSGEATHLAPEPPTEPRPARGGLKALLAVFVLRKDSWCCCTCGVGDISSVA